VNDENLRRGNPNWVKGVSGNPAGRSRMDPILRTKIRNMSNAIADRLYEITMESDSHASSVQAAKLLLAYAWGSPEALLEHVEGSEKRAVLTAEEKRAMARTLLAEQQAAEAVSDDDDAGETH
jgi:hypothetical protein